MRLLISSISPMLLAYFFFICFKSSSSKQFYDPNPCSSTSFSPASHYTCTNPPITSSCRTFVVYRSQPGFETVSEIAALFDINRHQVLLLNNLTDPSQPLEKDREVLLPIQCSCSAGFFQSNATYSVPPAGAGAATYTAIACETLEGLSKLPALIQANPPGASPVGRRLTIPLRCACPDGNDTKDGFQYLVTYPIVEFDTLMVVAERFRISPSDIWEQNSLLPFPTIYPNTTVLLPLRTTPSINSSVVAYPHHRDPDEGFVPLSPTRVIGSHAGRRRRNNLYYVVIGSAVGALIAGLCLLYYCKSTTHNCKQRGGTGSDQKVEEEYYASARSSTASCLLSPYLVAEMSKYSLVSYSIEELSGATMDFSEDTKLGASVHKGNFGGTALVVKKMGFGDARRTIGIHSMINHTNIVKLEGVCYGDGDLEFSPSYLVFEFAANGSLRDCLRNPTGVGIPWHRRTQIAFDVAIGLHYLNHCTTPSYIHMNINSRNIFITQDWRGKIANLGVGSAAILSSSKERRGDVVMSAEGWIAPEYLHQGLVSPKLDVFAFGVLLLELVSAKEARDGSFLVHNLGFLSGIGSANGGCFNELRGFVDPCLKEDYPIAEALCMTVLAKSCVEDNPLHRPSMDDILKILARMER